MSHDRDLSDHDLSDEQIRAWLRWVLLRTALKPTPLAKESGLAPSTLLRALDTDNPVSLERRSIRKIMEKFKLPGPANYLEEPEYRQRAFYGGGLSEDEVTAIEKAAGLAPTQGEWRVNTRAVELAGFLINDRFIADSAVTPRELDVVIAQIVRQSKPGAETVLRVYDPPYLVTATTDDGARRKPALVDNTYVSIWGPVVKLWRERAA